jgi:hypothetical protein
MPGIVLDPMNEKRIRTGFCPLGEKIVYLDIYIINLSLYQHFCMKIYRSDFVKNDLYWFSCIFLRKGLLCAPLFF